MKHDLNTVIQSLVDNIILVKVIPNQRHKLRVLVLVISLIWLAFH